MNSEQIAVLKILAADYRLMAREGGVAASMYAGRADAIEAAIECIERLPVTADGVRVAVGDTLYADSTSRYHQFADYGGVIPVEVGVLLHNNTYGCVMFDWDEVYSTHEAAAAAQAKEARG